MKLVLHQFAKEFRYLRFRWFIWLAALLFEMAINLEWLMPIQAGVESPGWIPFLPAILLLIGASLLLSCPEDRPGSDESFIGTRPIAQGSYWVSRVLIWLLLIVIPAVVQVGLYLGISGRPPADVLRGMGERFVVVAGYTGWLIPTLALWRVKELWKVAIVIGVTWFFGSAILGLLFHLLNPFSYVQHQSLSLVGIGVFALLSTVVVWRHLTRGYSLRFRLVCSAIACIAGLATTRFVSYQNHNTPPTAYDPALVERLAETTTFDFDLAEAKFEGKEKSYGPLLRGQEQVAIDKPGVHVAMVPRKTVFEQDGETRLMDDLSDEQVARRAFTRIYDREVNRGNRALASFFPPRTFLRNRDRGMPRWTRDLQALTELVMFPEQPPRFDEPLSFKTDFDVEWYQRDLAIEIPIEEGAVGECEEVRWEILKVERGAGPDPGILTVHLREESRTHWDAQHEHATLLHLPDLGVVRLDPDQNVGGSVRATETGWRHRKVELSWSYILKHKDGVDTGVDLVQARLILLRSRFLGQSSVTWASPEVTLSDLPSNFFNELQWYSNDRLHARRTAPAFRERLETLTAPNPESSEAEARRYAYDLFRAAAVTRAVYVRPTHSDIREAFAPLGQHQLPLMLELRTHNWPGWSNRPPNSLLAEYVTDQQKDVLVSRATENSMTASLVLEKGWSEDAKRHRDELIAAPAISEAAQTLLLDWIDDPEVAARLMEAAPHDWYGSIIRALDDRPETRSDIEALVLKEFDEALMLQGASWTTKWFERAANVGSAEALELCMKWLMLREDDTEGYYHIAPRPALLNADGSDYWRNDPMPPHERQAFWRGLGLSDFEYVPEKRAWRFLQP
ncbi:MAG: hypothetical protein AAF236_06140 [Verrucomicrobiota bacterium]